jgi:hypothetical protein
MADNIALPDGTKVATKEIAGAHVQKQLAVDETGAPIVPAGQETLAAVLAKLSDPASQTTLAAILAKIIASPATAALQTALNTLMTTANGYLATLAGSVASTDPARTALMTGTIYEGTTALTVKALPISLAASGDIVPAVAGKKIRVLALALTMSVKTTIKFQANGATDLTGAFPCGVDGGFVLPLNEHGWFTTTEGHKLNGVLGIASNVGGVVVYAEVE